MKYKGTRQLLTGILAVMLDDTWAIVGLASPIRTQAASKVGVQIPVCRWCGTRSKEPRGNPVSSD